MKIYDLSCMIDENLWKYEEPYVPYESEKFAHAKVNGYNATKHVITSHTGTHIECAKHWYSKADGVENIRLETVTGNAKVFKIDCSGKEHVRITKAMLIEAGIDRLESGDICILATGWDCHMGDDRYMEQSPYLALDAADYLVEKKPKLLAVDTPFLGDPVEEHNYAVSNLMLPEHVLLHNGIPFIAAMTGCMALPENVFFSGAPLKLKGAEGSPIRAYAIEF